MNRTALRRLAAAALIAAAVWFLVDAIATNWQALREHDWRVRPVVLAVSVVAHVAVLAWGVLVWSRVVRLFAGTAVPRAVLLRIWFLSNLARYVPGKIFQFVAVAQLARAASIPAGMLLASLVVHTGLALLAALVLAGFTLGDQLIPAVPASALGSALLLAATLLVHPALLRRCLALAGRITRRDLLRWNGRWRDGVLLLLLSLGSWVLYGVAYYLFLVSLTPLPVAALPALAGINALAFVAGYLAIVTPAGLGVREAAMTALLLPLMPRSVAALLAIASRLWTIAAEVAGGGAVLLLARDRPEPPARPATGVGVDVARDA